jgi:hypothetical protein
MIAGRRRFRCQEKTGVKSEGNQTAAEHDGFTRSAVDSGILNKV